MNEELTELQKEELAYRMYNNKDWEGVARELQQENAKLKQMVNSPSITFTTCPECGKNYSINYCREVHNLKQQLKDKDEKSKLDNLKWKPINEYDNKKI